MAGWFPVVSITGPRQSGKSTLVKDVFSDYEYVNLEDMDTRTTALEDPVGFIRDRPRHLVIDEAQLVPDLFSMIQVVSDETGAAGQYILSGSQNFLLLKGISQSLAGRMGLLKLMPLTLEEIRTVRPDASLEDFMLRGGYPRLYDVDIPERIYFDGYVSTYLERDVAGYLDVRNVRQFETFMRLVAQTAGGLLNVTRLANDAGISTKTANAWLSILESSYVVFRLPPFYANLRKRLVKTPKVYFHDTGLLCHLLGIRSSAQLAESPLRGAVFENLIVSETLKRHFNAAVSPDVCFYRDSSGKEVDLVDLTDSPELAEVKYSMTYKSAFAKAVEEVAPIVGADDAHRFVIMRRKDHVTVGGVQAVPAEEWLLRR